MAKYLSTKETAERLGVTSQTVINWCNDGLMPDAFMVAGVWAIPEASLDQIDSPKLGRPYQNAQEVLHRVRYKLSIGRYADAKALSKKGIDLAQEEGDGTLESQGYIYLGWAYIHQESNLEQAREHFLTGLSTAEAANSSLQIARLHGGLGHIAYRQGDYPLAISHNQQALTIYRQIDDKSGVADTLHRLGIIANTQRDHTSAHNYFQQVLDLGQELADKRKVASILLSLGEVARYQGQYATARNYYEQALTISREIDHWLNQTILLLNLAQVASVLGEAEVALTQAQEGLKIAQLIKARFFEAAAYFVLGKVLFHNSDQWSEAIASLHQALKKWRRMGEKAMPIEAKSTLAQIYLAQEENSQALHLTEEILVYLDEHGNFNETQESHRIYLTCYQVLVANKDKRATKVLQAVYDELQAKVEAMPDEDSRQAFLKNVPWNREIMLAYPSAVHNHKYTS